MFSLWEIKMVRECNFRAALTWVIGGYFMAFSTRATAFPLIVQPGDTLPAIAERVYGRADYERILAAANGLGDSGSPTLASGMRLEVPALGYRVAVRGDTWPELATRLLGAPQRANVLALANDSKPGLSPVEGAELVVPYSLSVTITDGGELFASLAERFLGNRRRGAMLAQYNGLAEGVLATGRTVLVPLTELPLTEAGMEAERNALGTSGEFGRERRASQRAAAGALPGLLAQVRSGRYVDAVARGVALLARSELTSLERASVQRQLLEAYAALGAKGRARDACGEWRQADPRAKLDPRLLSPKLLAACEATP
jgi:phage tail protein X